MAHDEDVREYLTQQELDHLRTLCKRPGPVPVLLVRRLLHDRDEWVNRAFENVDKFGA